MKNLLKLAEALDRQIEKSARTKRHEQILEMINDAKDMMSKEKKHLPKVTRPDMKKRITDSISNRRKQIQKWMRELNDITGRK